MSEEEILHKFMSVVNVTSSDKDTNIDTNIDTDIDTDIDIRDENKSKTNQINEVTGDIKIPKGLLEVMEKERKVLKGVYNVPDLKFNTMVMVSSIERKINLDIVAKYIKLSDSFISKPVKQKSKDKNKDKNKDVSKVNENEVSKVNEVNEVNEINEVNDINKVSFGNQITFDHKDSQSGEILNVKLFSNGMIVLAGCKETEIHPNKAILDLVKILKCKGDITIPILSNINKFVTKDRTNWTKIARDSIPIYNKLAELINSYLKLELPTDLLSLTISNDEETIKMNKKNKKSGNLLLTESLEQKLAFIFTVYQILSIYYDPQLILSDSNVELCKDITINEMNKKIDIFMALLKHICDNYNEIKREFNLNLQSYYDSLEDPNLIYNPINLRIALINMGFKMNYNIDRVKAAEILIDKYKQKVQYDPDLYQGCKITYKSDKDCCIHNLASSCKMPTKFITESQIHETNNARELASTTVTKVTKGTTVTTVTTVVDNCKCSCNNVTISIFRNHIIITAAKSWKQILDAYNFLNIFLTNEKENIQIFVNTEMVQKKKQTASAAICHNDCIYLSKAHILSNPRNFLLLKKLGMLEAFS